MAEVPQRKGNPVGYFLFSVDQHCFPKGREKRCLDASPSMHRRLSDRAHVLTHDFVGANHRNEQPVPHDRHGPGGGNDHLASAVCFFFT
jgi:hypothetical protein